MRHVLSLSLFQNLKKVVKNLKGHCEQLVSYAAGPGTESEPYIPQAERPTPCGCNCGGLPEGEWPP